MKEIQGFSIPQLRNKEAYSFLTKVSREASAYLNWEGDDPMVDAFKDALRAFDEALQLDTVNPYTVDIQAAIEGTDKLWIGTRNHLKGMANFPDAAKAATATKALGMVEKYGNITQMSQGERYGSLMSLTQDFRLIPAEELSAIGLDIWVGELEKSSSLYTIANKNFIEEEAKHEKGITKQRRGEAEDAYKFLVKQVNAKSIAFADGRHDAFIDNVNVLIDLEKTKLASRKTRAENSKEEEASEETDTPE